MKNLSNSVDYCPLCVDNQNIVDFIKEIQFHDRVCLFHLLYLVVKTLSLCIYLLYIVVCLQTFHSTIMACYNNIFMVTQKLGHILTVVILMLLGMYMWEEKKTVAIEHQRKNIKLGLHYTSVYICGSLYSVSRKKWAPKHFALTSANMPCIEQN